MSIQNILPKALSSDNSLKGYTQILDEIKLILDR